MTTPDEKKHCPRCNRPWTGAWRYDPVAKKPMLQCSCGHRWLQSPKDTQQKRPRMPRGVL